VPNLFANAADWLPGKLQEAAGVSATYTRAAGGSALTITPWVGSSEFTTDGGDRGAWVLWGDRDYRLLRSELVNSSGTEVQPALGDRIAETVGGVACVFEVQSGANGEHWRWANRARTWYQLHVKKVS
jgi:hypothetical protein